MLSLINLVDLIVRAVLIPGIFLFIFASVPEVREDFKKISKWRNKRAITTTSNTHYKRAA